MKQMKVISVVWGLILLAIVALLTTFGIIYNNKNKIYTDYEKKMVNATQKYVEASFAYPKDGSVLKISLEDLASSNKIKKLTIDKEECDGYVTVKKDDMVYKYKAYLMCSDYQTKNYDKNK